MKRILVATLLAAIGLSAVAGVSAAPPIRDVVTISESDPDFCGTGDLVTIEGTIRSKAWLGTTGGDPNQAVKAQLNIHITYTNPDTGVYVVERWSFSATNEIISGLESGVHTHEFTERGLKAMFRLGGGGVLTRDAGVITYRVTFDEDDNVTDFQLITMHGPHPGFSYEGDLFCDTLVPALGLD